jgi:hypothetical protein
LWKDAIVTKHKPENLTGQKAILKTHNTEEAVTLGPAQLTWEGGIQLHSNESLPLHPEIRGKLQTEKDHSRVLDAELILSDGRVFTVSFVLPRYFVAHEPSTSRTRVSYE